MRPGHERQKWLHPATQRNVAQLQDDGCQFLGPAEGSLACGYEGTGRMLEPAEIIEAVARTSRP